MNEHMPKNSRLSLVYAQSPSESRSSMLPMGKMPWYCRLWMVYTVRMF